MPQFLEKRLAAEYLGEKAAPFKIMNSIGAMRGSKETAKGREMEAKHKAKLAANDNDEDDMPMKESPMFKLGRGAKKNA